jgi:hypothetical protein
MHQLTIEPENFVFQWCAFNTNQKKIYRNFWIEELDYTTFLTQKLLP